MQSPSRVVTGDFPV